MTSPRPGDRRLMLSHHLAAYNSLEARSNQIEAVAWRLLRDLAERGEGSADLIAALQDALREPWIEPWT